MSENILSLHSRALNSDLFELNAAQQQAETLVSGFVEHATDGYSLTALTAGGLVYRLGRVGTLALGSRLLAGYLSPAPL